MSTEGTALHCIKKENLLGAVKNQVFYNFTLNSPPEGSFLEKEPGWCGAMAPAWATRRAEVCSCFCSIVGCPMSLYWEGVRKPRHHRHHEGGAWASGHWLEAWRSMRGIMAVLCDLRVFLLNLVCSPPKQSYVADPALGGCSEVVYAEAVRHFGTWWCVWAVECRQVYAGFNPTSCRVGSCLCCDRPGWYSNGVIPAGMTFMTYGYFFCKMVLSRRLFLTVIGSWLFY